MRYIVFDLEWNQVIPYNRDENSEPVALPCEIIQIGAARLDENMRLTDTFNTLVRPTLLTKLHPRVKALTGISAADLYTAPVFEQAFNRFKSWCKSDFLFFTWGPDDMPVLHKNIRHYKFSEDWLPDCFNLQIFFNSQTNQPPGQRSLSFAMELFGIESQGHMHNALTDAMCTAAVMQKLDIKRGLQELRERSIVGGALCASCDEGILERVAYDFADKSIALQNQTLGELRCPCCHAQLNKQAKWSMTGTLCYGAIAKCRKHGAYLFRLRLSRHGNMWRAIRLTRSADEGAQREFYSRVQKRRAWRQKRGIKQDT